jgi:hypothetical protein
MQELLKAIEDLKQDISHLKNLQQNTKGTVYFDVLERAISRTQRLKEASDQKVIWWGIEHREDQGNMNVE